MELPYLFLPTMLINILNLECHTKGSLITSIDHKLSRFDTKDQIFKVYLLNSFYSLMFITKCGEQN